MHYIPVKTRILQPPQDDLLAVLDKSVTEVKEGDVMVISSKVVAIHEGNCRPLQTTDKAALVRAESDLTIERDYWPSPLTVTNNAFIGSAGIDESNANGYLVSLPTDSFTAAKYLHKYFVQRFDLRAVGVIITDSHSTPLRRGATGIAIGWWGFEPIINHVGEEDLFGRKITVEVANIVDGLAAGATVVMGEVALCQPVVIIRDAPNLTFTDRPTKDDLFVSFADDTFRVLYKRFIPPACQG